ncbi:PSP1 C-terminal conserved region-domain-containing protein [Jimgerdemannia flammicorona]|uniref:PSP1 C-terminal conserved region-domain-containing protein n=1 Tax=Jimgerdemannia flammicorona TaxID=994334 RepID=A0A433DE38_9FUNG|nr:PSP1 C-terminal conserved region-domain-containing protein [Jimgerdemannia flammicorona]
MDEYSHLSHRRHSVAGTSLSFNTNHSTTRYLSDALESLDLGEVREAPTYPAEQTYPSREFMETVDEYFDNDDHRTRAYHEMGKGIPLHQVPHHGPLYVVEFKAGRTDLFYVADNSVLTIKKGDLVIVEADRGKDLGKVTVDNLTPQQVQLLQAQQADVAGDSHRMNKELHPKRIYRLAQPAEVTMLMGKSQDEAKAMMVCQTKVRQKKLPMEVVDAEYQCTNIAIGSFWSQGSSRIDFRELVRDLFKIYKTRIWMCAVNPLSKK